MKLKIYVAKDIQKDKETWREILKYNIEDNSLTNNKPWIKNVEGLGFM